MNPQFEYFDGQIRSTFTALQSQFEKLNEQARNRYDFHADEPYGEHPRQRFDWFSSQEPVKGLVIYYHAGYWQSRDKSLFHFLAPSYVDHGWHFALVNYPLCPDVSLQELTALVGPSLQTVRAKILQQQDLPIILMGHSAGGQIAVELTLANMRAAGQRSTGVHGVIGISGVYDPEPLINTSLNENLKLTASTAQAANVMVRTCTNAVPGLWVVGAEETNEFLRQNQAQHEHWCAENNHSVSLEIADTDHLSVLQAVMEWPKGNNQTFNHWLARVLGEE